MKLRFERRAADEALVLWLLTACVLACAAYGIGTRYERAIEAADRRAGEYVRRTVANERTVREAALLQRAEHQADADLRGIFAERSPGDAMAGFIGNVENSADVNRVTVTMVEPEAIGRPSEERFADRVLVAQPVTLRARGDFAALLRFLAGITRPGLPVEIDGSEIALINIAAAERRRPALDARIHAVLYHLAQAAKEKERYASTAR